MGFYLREAICWGPFRLNLSKSGFGVSFGITGLRIGTGPTGPYIHAGRYGLYYKKSLKNLLNNQEEINDNVDNVETDEISAPAPILTTKQKIFKYIGNFIIAMLIFMLFFLAAGLYFLLSLFKLATEPPKRKRKRKR